MAIHSSSRGGHQATHPHAESEHGEANTVAQAGRGQKPGTRRGRRLASDVVDDELCGLSLPLRPPRPLRPAILPKRAVKNHHQLQSALVQTGLGERRQIAEHCIPLASTNPVGLVAPVEPLKARVCVNQNARWRGRRRQRAGMMGMVVVVVVMVVWGLTACGSRELEKIYRNCRPRAAFLQILLKPLNSHFVSKLLRWMNLVKKLISRLCAQN